MKPNAADQVGQELVLTAVAAVIAIDRKTATNIAIAAARLSQLANLLGDAAAAMRGHRHLKPDLTA